MPVSITTVFKNTFYYRVLTLSKEFHAVFSLGTPTEMPAVIGLFVRRY